MTQAPARPHTVRWLLADLFMIRIAGLPAEVLDELHSPASADWAGSVLRWEADIRTRSVEVADGLERAIAGCPDDLDARRKMINLRRDAFNHRPARDRGVAADVAARVDATTRSCIVGWLDAWDGYRRVLDRGGDTVASDLVRQRAVLQRLAVDPVVRNGLVLASPVLDRQLETFIAATGPTLGKRARRIERSVGEYVLRTAAKTSPFSTLTSVALGRIGDTGTAALRLAGNTTPRSHTRLNMAILARLASTALDTDELLEDLPVALTTGWRIDGERIRYLRRRHTAGATGEDAVFVLDPLHENLFFLSASGLVTDVLTVMSASPRLRFGELVDRLVARGRGTRDDLRRYGVLLLRLGLLVVPGLRIDINAAGPTAAFRAQLAGMGLPWTARLAERIGTIDEMVHRYPEAEAEVRRDLLEEIRAELRSAQAELGWPDDVPRTLLYEDTAIPAVATASRASWDATLRQPLLDLAALLPLFDITVPSRLNTKGYFRARYGAGASHHDFTQFAHEYVQDFFEHYTARGLGRPQFDAQHRPLPQENWFRLPEMPALDSARAALADHVAQRYADLPAGADELTLDPEMLRHIGDGVPDTVGEVASWSLFLQLSGGDEPVAVLNRCFGGLTQQFSRFAHCFDDAAGLGKELRRMLDAARPEGAVFAELKGGYDATNLNLHPIVTDYELVCQGELSFRPADEQIPVDDLYVVDDRAGDRLRLYSRRLGCEVVPVYLGFLAPMMLPEIQQVLLTFGVGGMAEPDLWAGVAAARPTGAPVVVLPRIRHGALVLQRRTWRISREAVPERTDDPAANFLAWARLRDRHGIPRRVFASGKRADAPGRRVKPSFVDFEQHLSVALLGDLAGDTDTVVLTEMLPDRDRLWLCGDSGTHVTELVVQLSATRMAAS